MVFCTIEEAWGDNFSNINIVNNIDKNNNIDYKKLNYDDINYNNIDLNKIKNTSDDEINKIENVLNNEKIKIKKIKGGKKKNKKKMRKLKGGNLLSEDFDIFYYIIIGIILVILVDTFYKLGKNN